MKIYLVGGAIRDRLLGIDVKDKDWVVVGTTVDAMKKKGFISVGKHFPVFIHPNTGEEYALARTEKKQGHGYTEFDFHAEPTVSLQTDLKRRDLTINAIAEAENGELIDPFGGIDDIKNKILRHVSTAFREDPLRLLRVARFAARFKNLGFTIHDNTKQLMKDIVESGEVHYLVSERIWQETETALKEPSPITYFKVLSETGALNILMPDMSSDIVCYGTTSYRSLVMATSKTNNTVIRFVCAILSWNDNSKLSHNTLDKVDKLCTSLKVPNKYSQLAKLTATFFDTWCLLNKNTTEATLYFLESVDAFRRKERFFQLLNIYDILTKVIGLDKDPSDYVISAYNACIKLDIGKMITVNNLQKHELQEAIHKQRLKIIKNTLQHAK